MSETVAGRWFLPTAIAAACIVLASCGPSPKQKAFDAILAGDRAELGKLIDDGLPIDEYVKDTLVIEGRKWQGPGRLLDFAISKGKYESATLLLDRGAVLYNQYLDYSGNQFTKTILDGQYELAERLIRAGADIDADDREYNGTLERIVAKGDKKAVDLILANGPYARRFLEEPYGVVTGSVLTYSAAFKGKQVYASMDDKTVLAQERDGQYVELDMPALPRMTYVSLEALNADMVDYLLAKGQVLDAGFSTGLVDGVLGCDPTDETAVERMVRIAKRFKAAGTNLASHPGANYSLNQELARLANGNKSTPARTQLLVLLLAELKTMGFDPNVRRPEDPPAIVAIVDEGDTSMAAAYLLVGADLQAKDSEGRSGLSLLQDAQSFATGLYGTCMAGLALYAAADAGQYGQLMAIASAPETVKAINDLSAGAVGLNEALGDPTGKVLDASTGVAGEYLKAQGFDAAEVDQASAIVRDFW